MHARNISGDDFIALSKELTGNLVLLDDYPRNILEKNPRYIYTCQSQIPPLKTRPPTLQSAKDISLCTQEKERGHKVLAGMGVGLPFMYSALSAVIGGLFLNRWKKQIEDTEERLKQEKILAEQKRREEEAFQKQVQDRSIAESMYLKEDITVPPLALKKPLQPKN